MSENIINTVIKNNYTRRDLFAAMAMQGIYASVEMGNSL